MNFDFGFGEMTLYEREKLYNYVLENNPDVILECGSGVGASTYVMVNALGENSKIYSCDPDRTPIFSDPRLNFYSIPSDLLIADMITNNIYPDFIFFDGPEEPEVALNDFKELDKYLKIGTIFSMHDWCTVQRKLDNGFSTKAELVKPYINSLTNWELIEETENNQDSVGLCFYKKILE